MIPGHPQADIEVEVVVVGAGLTGSAAAWELARRRHSVAVIEAFDLGHKFGSSHGSARIYRRAYADPLYIDLTGRADELWRELEYDTSTSLRRQTGGLDHGVERNPALIAELLMGAGVKHELLSAGAASERWPEFVFDGDVLFHPDAGTLDADSTMSACLESAVARGATVHPNTEVQSIHGCARGVLIRTSGPTFIADRVVLAAGPWLPALAGSVTIGSARLALPDLVVTQQQVFHFEQRNPDVIMPIFVHKRRMETYGLRSGADAGSRASMKVALHDRGTPTTASARTGVIDAEARTRLIEYVRHYLPGLIPEPIAEASCIYTSSATDDFILDRVGPVVLASPCSGHGAKFAPLIGVMCADLAFGVGEPEARFSLIGHGVGETA